MNRFFFYLALLGWFLSLAAHLKALAGVDVAAQMPYVWGLHVGIFAVFIPAILKLRKNEEFKQLPKQAFFVRMNPVNTFRIMFKDTPDWFAFIALAGFVYALFNFLYLVLPIGDFLHGRAIDTTSLLPNSHVPDATSIRLFSGHWIAFYGISAAILYPSNDHEIVQPEYPAGIKPNGKL